MLLCKFWRPKLVTWLPLATNDLLGCFLFRAFLCRTFLKPVSGEKGARGCCFALWTLSTHLEISKTPH